MKSSISRSAAWLFTMRKGTPPRSSQSDERRPPTNVRQGIRLSDPPGGSIRDARVKHLACSNRIVESSHDLFRRRDLVPDMDPIKVDVVGLDNHWRGVPFRAIAEQAVPHESARFVLCTGYDFAPGTDIPYTVNVPLNRAVDDDVRLVHTWEGKPLPRERGRPVRMITPKLYAWKGAKWIRKMEFLADDRKGFWEVRVRQLRRALVQRSLRDRVGARLPRT
jgi:hypothetical protein